MKAIRPLLLEYSKRFDDRSQAIVISSRIRLARNFTKFKFPAHAQKHERYEILAFAKERIRKIKELEVVINLSSLDEMELLALQERRIISKELCLNTSGAGVICSASALCSVMINEEDHLRMQTIKNGLQLKEAWKEINAIDNAIDDGSYAFSQKIGYLTACPSNVGTGMRASVMLHLPGLVLTNRMQHLVNAVQQIGITVRGMQGEGSQDSGSIFQISNQQTLGIREVEEIQRLKDIIGAIVDQENTARHSFLEKNRMQVFDKIGRIYGILRSSYVLSSDDSLEMLSWMRLAVDLGILDEKNRPGIDRYMTESQPGNLCTLYDKDLLSEERDCIRAENLRIFFRQIKEPRF